MMNLKSVTLIFMSLLLLISPLNITSKSNATETVIDDFEEYSAGQELNTNFHLWSSSSATANFTAVQGGWGNNSMSAKATITDTQDKGWITMIYTPETNKRNWSTADGISFRIKSFSNKTLNIYIDLNDAQGEPWSAGYSTNYYIRNYADNAYSTLSGSSGGIPLPVDFDGEVVIPFSSFKLATWFEGSSNGKLDTNNIQSMNMGFDPSAAKGQSIYLDDIELYNSTSDISSFDFSMQDKTYIPSKTSEHVQMNAHVYNSMGIEIDDPRVKYSISPSDSNIQLNGDTMTVNPGAKSGVYTVKGVLLSDTSKTFEKSITITSEMSPQIKSVYNRIENRSFPSLHMAWNGIDDGSVVRRSIADAAKHDFLWNGYGFYGLVWQRENGYEGLSSTIEPSSITTGLKKRAQLLQANPDMLMLYSLEWIETSLNYLPADSPWWLLNSDGQKIKGWGEGGYQAYLLDVNSSDYRAMIAAKAKAIVQTGVVDGIFIDCWREDPAYIDLIRLVREAVGDNMLLMVNSNMFKVPQTAPYINGLFMECYKSSTQADWQLFTDTLVWAEKNLRSPQVNCLETWVETSRTSPADIKKMRATTTLSLTRSDGYMCFTDDNALPVGDHLHDFYDFWVKSLKGARGAGFMRSDKAWQRDYVNGTAIFNPIGNKAVTATFSSNHKSAATGIVARTFTVNAYDGDIFILTDSTPTASPEISGIMGPSATPPDEISPATPSGVSTSPDTSPTISLPQDPSNITPTTGPSIFESLDTNPVLRLWGIMALLAAIIIGGGIIIGIGRIKRRKS